MDPTHTVFVASTYYSQFKYWKPINLIITDNKYMTQLNKSLTFVCLLTPLSFMFIYNEIICYISTLMLFSPSFRTSDKQNLEKTQFSGTPREKKEEMWFEFM